jgi:hypothetical protein
MDSVFNALRADSFFALVCTRYLDDDAFGTVVEQEGIASWAGHAPAEKFEVTPNGQWHVYFLQARDRSNTANYPKGEPLLPEAGYTDKMLANHERRKPQEHSSQYMNDPSTGEHMEITREQIRQLVIPRSTNPPIEYATVHLDTAFKDEDRRERGDYSVIVVWLHDLRPNGIVYLDRALRGKWKGEEFDTLLVRVLWDLRSRGIRILAVTDEAEQGGKRGVYKQRLEQVITGAGLRLMDIYQWNRSGTKKVMRIREAAGCWVDGYVRLFEDAENLEPLIEEMVKIGRTKYDDLSDAAADVFRPEIWRGRIASDRDGQPPLPIQPGDEILKAQHARDMEAMHNDIFGPDNFVDPERTYEQFGFGPANGRLRH